MAKKYIQRYDYEWVDVTCGETAACCDCGLVHDFNYKLKTDKDGIIRILRRAIRNNRATAAKRRRLKSKKEGVFKKRRG